MAYSNKTLDGKFAEVFSQIKSIEKIIDDRVDGFEKDVRESLSRLETTLFNVQNSVEARLREERDITNKERAPMLAWTIIWGLAALLGIAVATGVFKYFGINI